MGIRLTHQETMSYAEAYGDMDERALCEETDRIVRQYLCDESGQGGPKENKKDDTSGSVSADYSAKNFHIENKPMKKRKRIIVDDESEDENKG